MKSPRIDIASIRREQIIEAAIAVIHEQGIQNLSLSEIEKRAEMSRGQLTYYFPSKEDILLAVFDRVVELMHDRMGQPPPDAGGLDMTRYILEKLLVQPMQYREFGCLQYTFLAQMPHREDFRQRLSTLYGMWRDSLSDAFLRDFTKRKPHRPVSSEDVARVVQALLHGMVMQRVTQPAIFDGAAAVEICIDMISNYIWGKPRERQPSLAGATIESKSARIDPNTGLSGSSILSEVHGE